MKKTTKLGIILFFTCSCNVLLAQNDEKVLEIKERRHPYSAVMDTASRVHQKGEVAIDRINMSADTTEPAYSIHVLISCNNRLVTHHMNFIKKNEFDKFSYKWTSDNILSITFINSKTNLRKKLLLVQYQDKTALDCELGFIKGMTDSFYDEY